MCHCALFQFITQDEQLILIKENGKNIVDLKTNGGYNVKRTDKENYFNQINARLKFQLKFLMRAQMSLAMIYKKT